MGNGSEAKWTWPRLPETDAEFEAMARSLDQHLAALGVATTGRSFRAAHEVAPLIQAVNGNKPVILLGREAPTLIKRLTAWFDQTYAGRPNPAFRSRSVAVDLPGEIWRMTIPILMGNVQPFANRDLNVGVRNGITDAYNILHAMEGLTAFHAHRLTNGDIEKAASFFLLGRRAVERLEKLKGDPKFDEARRDYAASVDALVSGSAWNKARWETAQTAEKVMKGLMSLAKVEFPTGADGHKLKKVAKAFSDGLGVALPEDLIETIDCRPGARYGEENATREQAMASHVALLELLPLLIAKEERAS
jgi:hypothetical protein